ncbi:Metallo-dependent phosphatase-like protein [Dipodascopsis uninucleata]
MSKLASASLLLKQYRELTDPKHSMPSFHIELKDDNVYIWNLAVMVLNKESAFYGGYFKAEMRFPFDYPFNPPTFRFVRPLFHPNVYKDGRLCISILHPGEDETSGEAPSERWSPAQSVESVLISILSLFEDPNPDSAANVDAAVAWRNDRETYNKIIKRQAEISRQDMPEGFVIPESEVYAKPAIEDVVDDDFWYEDAEEEGYDDDYGFDDVDEDGEDAQESDIDEVAAICYTLIRRPYLYSLYFYCIWSCLFYFILCVFLTGKTSCVACLKTISLAQVHTHTGAEMHRMALGTDPIRNASPGSRDLVNDLSKLTVMTKENPERGAADDYSSVSSGGVDDSSSISTVDEESTRLKRKWNPTKEEQDQAARLKDEANKLLVTGNYTQAIEKYTEAIELDPEKEVYWSNRAQAHIKEEAYGSAIADATEAIRINSAYVKSYYRRAVAYTAILRPKDALRDFNAVVQKAPSDKSARIKRDECQKLVRRLAFEAAIEVEDEVPVSQTIDYMSMTVEDSYDGVRLEVDGQLKITPEFVHDMIERFKSGKKLHRKYVFAIIIETMKIFIAEPTMVEVDVKNEETITVCGDTHGQFFDLLELFRINGPPGIGHKFLFNGDFVDRGSWSTEVALLLFSYKWLYPKDFFLNRGNHEADDMNKVYGFEGECKAKYSEKVFKVFSEAFSKLPLASLIGSSYLVLHGGLFSDDKITLDDVRKFNRFKQKQPGQSGLMMEMLWTDPQPMPGRGPSKRGVGLQFGPDVTKRFCENNNIMAVIRSHEVRMDGYEVEHDGRLITVFSAPNYCDSQGNKGATITIDSKNELHFKTFEAVPHPDVRPMAYASNLMM